ncbi:MAG: hypothetical protein C0505_00675 [Leptothrix sp. (in: Bacteria)]|nr:hypothetical protein [Leptothrix sp. (in: b-proteobacteria)]
MPGGAADRAVARPDTRMRRATALRCRRQVGLMAVGMAVGTAVAMALASPLATAADAAPPTLPPLVIGTALGDGWRVANLPQQKPPVTRYRPETVEGRAALRMEAVASYGNLLHEPPAGALPRLLQWSWRVAVPNPGTDLRHKAGDDVAAKVCLSFDLPLSRVPFGERLLLQLARARTGENLPAATLCWVWGGPEASGSVVDNAFSRRVRYVVLRNAADAGAGWLDESREIAADFARAFGDEAPAPPPLVAVLVGADADNTGGRSVAYLAAARFGP